MEDYGDPVASLCQRLEETRLASTNGTVTPEDYRRVDEAINDALRELPIHNSDEKSGPLLWRESIDPPKHKDLVPVELLEQLKELLKEHGGNVDDLIREPDGLAALLPGLDESELKQLLTEAKVEKEDRKPGLNIRAPSVTDSTGRSTTECKTEKWVDSPPISPANFSDWNVSASSADDTTERMTEHPSADPSTPSTTRFMEPISSPKFITRIALHPPTQERPLPPITLNRCTLERRWLTEGPTRKLELYEILVSLERCLSERTFFVRPDRGRSIAGKVAKLRGSSSVGIAHAVFGEVWVASEVEVLDEHYTSLHDDEGRVRQVAIKRMPRERIFKCRPMVKEDPMCEMTVSKALQEPGHPNVVTMVDALHDGDTIYFLTPFVSGEEMFEYVVNGEGPLEESVVRTLFRQIMEGIAYIHSKGICHGDISLENILVDEARQKVYIFGFGMAHFMPFNAEGQRLMSAPDGRRAKSSYCSPEQFLSKPYDGVKTDIFAAGSVLFSMLTKRCPFRQASRVDPSFRLLVFRGAVEETILRSGCKPVGYEAESLLKGMMAYRPEDRLIPEEVLHHPFLAE